VAPEAQLKVGVIGCGAGLFHLEGYKNEPRAKVVALAGLNTERCRELAREYDVPRLFGEYDELLAEPDIDAVSIVVPNYLHLPVTLAALEAGKHVLVEKPLARTAAEGEQMIAAARKAERVLAVALNYRYRGDAQVLKQHIATGALGRIYYAKAFWLRRAGIPGLGSWFTKKEMAGGGPLIDLGVHVLDLALCLMGNPEPTTVSAATYSELGPQGKGFLHGGKWVRQSAGDDAYEVEDLATALIRLDSGATLQLEVAWAAYAGVTDEFGVTLMGDKGGAEIHIKDYAPTDTLRVFGDVGGVPADCAPRVRPQHGHSGVVRQFVDSILAGAPVSPSGEEGLARVRLIDAIYRSAQLGREIEMGDGE